MSDGTLELSRTRWTLSNCTMITCLIDPPGPSRQPVAAAAVPADSAITAPTAASNDAAVHTRVTLRIERRLAFTPWLLCVVASWTARTYGEGKGRA